MTIEKIVDYVLHTPFNINKAILVEMLEQLIRDNGGSGGSGGSGDSSGSDIVYDGGLET